MTPPVQSPVSLRTLLEEMIERDASDLHITAGDRPKLRVDGDIAELRRRARAHAARHAAAGVLGADGEPEEALRDGGRAGLLVRHRRTWRASAATCFKQRGCVSMVMRQIPFQIKTFADLAAAAGHRQLRRDAARPGAGHRADRLGQEHDAGGDDRQDQHASGAGTSSRSRTPSSSSTVTAAASSTSARSAPTRRASPSALKYALREDPDVILIGEMRDLETIQAGASPSPRPVTSCSPRCTPTARPRRSTASSTCSRATSRARCAPSWRSCSRASSRRCCSRRCPGKGRAMAAEMLVVTPAIRALIRDDKVHQIYSIDAVGQEVRHADDERCAVPAVRHAPGERRRVRARRRAIPNEFLRMIGKAPGRRAPQGPDGPARDRPDASVGGGGQCTEHGHGSGVRSHGSLPVLHVPSIRITHAIIHVYRPHQPAASSSPPRSTRPAATRSSRSCAGSG